MRLRIEPRLLSAEQSENIGIMGIGIGIGIGIAIGIGIGIGMGTTGAAEDPGAAVVSGEGAVAAAWAGHRPGSHRSGLARRRRAAPTAGRV